MQEIKSKNERLLEFLCRRDVIDHLLDFIIQPVNSPPKSPNDHNTITPLEMRIYKYPYISCEIICSEVPNILSNLVEEFDCVLLDKLFSFLSVSAEEEAGEHKKTKLDYYLSGYFEKILEMLFRRMTAPMMRYFNEAGIPLFKRFLYHIDNYSIMQIVQRLMLPHIPFSNSPEMDSIPYEEIRQRYQCNWSYLPEACKLLFDKMFDVPENADSTAADVPLHVSDLLITVLQLSPPETLVIKFLCEPACVNKLLFYACWDISGDSLADSSPQLIDGPTGSSPISNISLSAISVLESLISRLFESSLPMERLVDPNTNEVPYIDVEAEQAHIQHIKGIIDNISFEIIPYISQINSILNGYLSPGAAGDRTIVNQSKRRTPKLGHRGLQLVKFIESIVRIGVDEIDSALCDSDVFATCLKLFFKYETNSLLHLSVQRILINVIEGDQHSRQTQLAVLSECNLLNVIREKLGEYSVTASPDGEGEGRADEASRSASVTRDRMAAKHSSLMGSMVLIAQAVATVLDSGTGSFADSNTSGITNSYNMNHAVHAGSVQLTLPNRSANFHLLGTGHDAVEDSSDFFSAQYYEDAFADGEGSGGGPLSPDPSQNKPFTVIGEHSGFRSEQLFDSPQKAESKSAHADDFEATGFTAFSFPPPPPPDAATEVAAGTAAAAAVAPTELGAVASDPSDQGSQSQRLSDELKYDTDDDISFHSRELTSANEITANSLRSFLTAQQEAFPSSALTIPDLAAWDSFVETQLQQVLKHQVVGSYHASAAAAAAVAKGLGSSLFNGNNSGDLITADIGHFNDDFLHLGLSFDDGPEQPDDDDDDFEGRERVRDLEALDSAPSSSSGSRVISRSRTMGSFEGNSNNKEAFDGNGLLSYRDSYNLQMKAATEGSAHQEEGGQDRGGDSDRFLETINFAEFANFDSINLTDGDSGGGGGGSADGNDLDFVFSSGGSSADLNLELTAGMDFANFEEVDFSAVASPLDMDGPLPVPVPLAQHPAEVGVTGARQDLNM